jgi:division protein CdvB (Snf7/Vps24/ESCRT-III family)
MEENTIPEETLPMADCVDCDVCTCGKKAQEVKNINIITKNQETIFLEMKECFEYNLDTINTYIYNNVKIILENQNTIYEGIQTISDNISLLMEKLKGLDIEKPQEEKITSTQEECFCGKQACDCEE